MRRLVYVLIAATLVACGGGSDEEIPVETDAAEDVGSDGVSADVALDAATETAVDDSTTPDTNVADTNVADTATSEAAADAGTDSATTDSATDAAATKKGHAGLATVSGGLVMKSTNYKLLMTVGQGPGGNTNMSSANYRLRAGVVGATQ